VACIAAGVVLVHCYNGGYISAGAMVVANLVRCAKVELAPALLIVRIVICFFRTINNYCTSHLMFYAKSRLQTTNVLTKPLSDPTFKCFCDGVSINIVSKYKP